MSRYRAVVAELSTGIVRRPDAPTIRFQRGSGEESRTFESEEGALRFKDEILKQHSDLEVVVLSDEQKSAAQRFFIQDGQMICETTER
jgi:hypothetical protein